MHTQGIIPAKENASKKISDRYQKKTYAKGATCIYGDTLYRAKADITTAEEWTAAHWEETNMETIRAEMAAELSSLNANLSIKGSNQRIYGEASCSTEGEKRLASLSLKAGHTYMLIGETETNNGNTISTSCGIKIASGTVEYFPQMINRTRTDNGQGCNVVTVIKCTTDCVVYVYGYVYNPGSYKYQGNLISILLD